MPLLRRKFCNLLVNGVRHATTKSKIKTRTALQDVDAMKRKGDLHSVSSANLIEFHFRI